jgi:hypothetical protein
MLSVSKKVELYADLTPYVFWSVNDLGIKPLLLYYYCKLYYFKIIVIEESNEQKS